MGELCCEGGRPSATSLSPVVFSLAISCSKSVFASGKRKNMNHILKARHEPKNGFLESAHDLRMRFSSASEPVTTLNLCFLLSSVIYVETAKTWKTII